MFKLFKIVNNYFLKNLRIILVYLIHILFNDFIYSWYFDHVKNNNIVHSIFYFRKHVIYIFF